jgi:glycerophosphoryl diester phosphodiesterase
MASLGTVRAMQVIAHRGASGHALENTVSAFELSITMGAGFIETDVHMTSDGSLVLVHDTTLDRTTDARQQYFERAPWRVRDFTLAEIRGLAGDVPHLRELLGLADGRAGLLLEIKSPALYPGIGTVLASELEQAGWLGREELSVISFDWDFLAQLKAAEPRATVGVLGRPAALEQLAQLSTWAAGVHPSHEHVDADFVTAVHEQGMVTCVGTTDDRHRMGELVDMGVDGIFTNRPDALIGVMEARNYPADDTFAVHGLVGAHAHDEWWLTPGSRESCSCRTPGTASTLPV